MTRTGFGNKAKRSVANLSAKRASAASIVLLSLFSTGLAGSTTVDANGASSSPEASVDSRDTGAVGIGTPDHHADDDASLGSSTGRDSDSRRPHGDSFQEAPEVKARFRLDDGPVEFPAADLAERLETGGAVRIGIGAEDLSVRFREYGMLGRSVPVGPVDLSGVSLVIPSPRIRTFEGGFTGTSTGTAALTLGEDGRVHLSLDSDKWNVRIGPSGHERTGVDAPGLVAYRIMTRAWGDATMAATRSVELLVPGGPSEGPVPASAAPTTYRVLRVFPVVTEGFWKKHTSDWQQFVIDRINVVNSWMRASVGITILTESWAIWPGKYVSCSTDGQTLYNDFSSYVWSNHRGVVRDVAHLITESATNCGLSFTNGMGGEPGTYGWSNFEGSDWLRMERTLAHELGHNLNADHIQAQPSGLWDNTLMSYGTTLNKYSDGTLDATNNNAQRIRSYAAYTLPISVLSYGSSVTSDGLRLNYFDLYTASKPLVAGGQPEENIVNSRFTVTNTNSFPISFCAGGLRSAARDPAGANKDFGVILQSSSINAGVTVYGDGRRDFTSGGQWTIWPAYHRLVGGTGFDTCQWRDWSAFLYPYAYYLVPKTNNGGGSCFYDGSYTDSDAGTDLRLERYRLLATRTPVRVGDTVWAEMVVVNMRWTATFPSASPGFYVTGRNTQPGYPDFPATGTVTLSPFDTDDPNINDGRWGSHGGGVDYLKSRTVGVAGWWSFTPAYYSSQTPGNWEAFWSESCQISVA